MAKKISVDREEYEALCDLRDVAHERLKLRHAALEENYAACLSINTAQVSRLTGQELQIMSLHDKVKLLEKRVHDLEPARIDVGPQPLFAKGR